LILKPCTRSPSLSVMSVSEVFAAFSNAMSRTNQIRLGGRTSNTYRPAFMLVSKNSPP